jgi:hypothetical protein
MALEGMAEINNGSCSEEGVGDGGIQEVWSRKEEKETSSC